MNEVTIKNNATTFGPEVKATGGDANIDLDLSAKGTGDVNIAGGVKINQSTQTVIGDNIFESTKNQF